MPDKQPTPAAWLVIDNLGRHSVYLDHARAAERAALLHGRLVPLVPQTEKKS